MYKLKKSLHGLAQSPRLCYENLTYSLRAFGFKQLSFCERAFELKTETLRTTILLHVNELIILDSTLSSV